MRGTCEQQGRRGLPLLLTLGLVCAAGPVWAAPTRHWVGAWGEAMIRSPVPASALLSQKQEAAPLSDETLRQMVNVGVERARVHLSNVFGQRPLVLSAASVGLQSAAGGGELTASSLHALRFDGATTVTISAGSSRNSDPVTLPVKAGDTLGISLTSRNRGAIPHLASGYASSRVCFRQGKPHGLGHDGGCPHDRRRLLAVRCGCRNRRADRGHRGAGRFYYQRLSAQHRREGALSGVAGASPAPGGHGRLPSCRAECRYRRQRGQRFRRHLRAGREHGRSPLSPTCFPVMARTFCCCSAASTTSANRPWWRASPAARSMLRQPPHMSSTACAGSRWRPMPPACASMARRSHRLKAPGTRIRCRANRRASGSTTGFVMATPTMRSSISTGSCAIHRIRGKCVPGWTAAIISIPTIGVIKPWHRRYRCACSPL